MRRFFFAAFCVLLGSACKQDESVTVPAPGCTYDDTLVARADTAFISVPNALTPNSDGSNDVLRAATRGVDTSGFSVVILDGNDIVFSSDDPGFSWAPSGLGRQRKRFQVRLKWSMSGMSFESCLLVTVPEMNVAEGCVEDIEGLYFFNQIDPATGSFRFPSGEEGCP